MNITSLSVEVLQVILRHLNEVEKQELSSSHPILWQKCTAVKTAKPLCLTDRYITAFQLRTVTVIRILDQKYTENFITHIVSNARYLRVVQIDKRHRYSHKFKESIAKWFPQKLKIVYYPFDASNNLPNLHVITTPEYIRIALDSLKKKMKSQYAQETQSYQLKNQLEYLLPCHLNRFWKLREYSLINAATSKETLTASKANDLANHYGKLLTSAICIIDEYFFVITSSSVFIHQHAAIDDCAHHSTIAYQPKPVVYIRKHKRFRHDYHELSVRIGYLEILATGGFWGAVSDNTLVPFLGSSLSLLPAALSQDVTSKQSYQIFVNMEEPVDTVCTNRIMNQYLKKQSTMKWAYHSNVFYKSNFYPANPINFTSSNAFVEGASLLLRMYAHKTVQKKKMMDILEKIAKARNPSKPDTLVSNLLNYTKSRYPRKIILSQKELLLKRNELIQIYNDKLAGALKYANNKRQKEAMEKYKPKKINLFDD